jgi:hypothetical protein
MKLIVPVSLVVCALPLFACSSPVDPVASSGAAVVDALPACPTNAAFVNTQRFTTPTADYSAKVILDGYVKGATLASIETLTRATNRYTEIVGSDGKSIFTAVHLPLTTTNVYAGSVSISSPVSTDIQAQVVVTPSAGNLSAQFSNTAELSLFGIDVMDTDKFTMQETWAPCAGGAGDGVTAHIVAQMKLNLQEDKASADIAIDAFNWYRANAQH